MSLLIVSFGKLMILEVFMGMLMPSFIIVFGNIHLIPDPFLRVFVCSGPGEGYVATCDCRLRMDQNQAVFSSCI